MTGKKNILFIEDEKHIWNDLSDCFDTEIEQEKISLEFAATAKEGLQKISSNNNDLIIIDIILPDVPHDEDLYLIESLDRQISNNNIYFQGILTSAHKGIESLKNIEKQKDWIVDSFTKPYSRKSLRETVLNILNLNIQDNELYSLKENIQPELYNEIIQETGIIKFKLKRSVTDLIDAGKRIKSIKDKLPFGYYRDWIKTELKIHYTTVGNLINLADVFGDDIDKVIGIPTSALYRLAAPNTPIEARNKVLQLNDIGKEITFNQVKNIIKTYKNIENVTVLKEKTDSKINKITTPQNDLNQATRYNEKIIKVIKNTENSPDNEWINIRGNKIYNGNPEDLGYRESLPPEISLTIAFPPNKSYSLADLIPFQSQSISVNYSPFNDLDLNTLAKIVQYNIELYTEENEIVIFSFLPHPELILLVNELNCRCIVAEPRSIEYQNIVSMYEAIDV